VRASANGLNGVADTSHSRSSRSDSRKSDRATGFDEVLNGARRRSKEPAPIEQDRAPAAAENAKPARSKRTAKRETSAQEEPTATAESPDGSAVKPEPSARKSGSQEQSEAHGTQAAGEEQAVDPVDEGATDPASWGSGEAEVAAADAATAPIINVTELVADDSVDPTSTDSQATGLAAVSISTTQDAEKLAESADPTGIRPTSSTPVGGVTISTSTTVQPLDAASAAAPEQSPGGLPAGAPNAEDSGAQTQRSGLPTAGVARQAPTSASAESSPDAHPAPKQADADSDVLSVTSNAADVVEALDTAHSRPTTAASHVPEQSGPDPAAAVRALESFGTRQLKTDAPTDPGQLPHATPEARFAEQNHPTIVAGVRGQLLPTGGTMHLRLDPPELGPLAVTVRLHNGVMQASFETANDEAAKLLSHSLGALKTSLESQGVNVERLHVHQAPKSEQFNQNGNNSDREGQQGQSRDGQQDHAARQDHQRREMLRRMWRKLTGAEDPLDMVA
jgi:flagellar hook-length control protein FliK